MELRSGIIVCLLMAGIWSPAPGQRARDEDHLRLLYDSLFQTSRYVINGKLYHTGHRSGKGHPYFGSFSWTAGIIDNERSSTPWDAIRYDLVNDELLIQHFSVTGSHVIVVNPDIVQSFQLGDHRFYRLESRKAVDFDFEPGYYELAYKGQTELWIRWKKSFSERSSGSDEYVQTRTVFINLGHLFYRITGRKSLLRALPEREDEMESYLKLHGIVVRRAGADELISLVKYYDKGR